VKRVAGADGLAGSSSGPRASRADVLALVADLGGHVLIGRHEDIPARLDVVEFTTCEVRSELFEVDLPSDAKVGRWFEGQVPDLNDQDGLGAIAGQSGIEGFIKRRHALALAPGLLRLPGRHH